MRPTWLFYWSFENNTDITGFNPLINNMGLVTRESLDFLYLCKKIILIVQYSWYSSINLFWSSSLYFLSYFCNKNIFCNTTPLMHNMGLKWPTFISYDISCMAECFFAISFEINLFHYLICQVFMKNLVLIATNTYFSFLTLWTTIVFVLLPSVSRHKNDPCVFLWSSIGFLILVNFCNLEHIYCG